MYFKSIKVFKSDILSELPDIAFSENILEIFESVGAGKYAVIFPKKSIFKKKFTAFISVSENMATNKLAHTAKNSVLNNKYISIATKNITDIGIIDRTINFKKFNNIIVLDIFHPKNK